MFKLISIILILCILIFLFIYKKNIFKRVIFQKNLPKEKFNKLNNHKFNKKEYIFKSNYSQILKCYSNSDKDRLKKEMYHLFKGSKDQKIKALKIAEELSNKSILPILKMGLKDMDSDIIKLSAKLIQKFK
tara:strand:+ start:127 stop:519 length:393 start_codon:yes stop_codon:yes gene_type:complete